MKKIIKIFTLMLFIVLFFGITTSLALTVQDGTTANEMIAALEKGETLTGISHVVRKRNAYLYCRQHGQAISAEAKYTWANGTKENSIKVYPGTEANGYAKAYILAGGNYDKHNNDDKSNERQWAWWQILGQETGKNKVYIAAEAYQKFKTEGKDVAVKTEEAKTDVNNTNAIYGPITIEYSYISGTGYSFGGFNYAFFNTNGQNVSDKIQLCTLANGIYTPITSTKQTDGYYSVKTISYNNVNLYAVTQDKTIQKVNLKIQTNDLECEASVYEIKGTYKTGGHYNYCMDCHDMFENAIRHNDKSTVAQSIIAAYNAKALFLAPDGNYYEYSYNKTIRGQKFARYYYGSEYESGSQGAWTTSIWKLNGETIEYTSSCNTKAKALTAFGGLNKYIGNNGELPVCKVCNYVFPDISVEPQRTHIYDHITTGGYYTSTSYYFVRYNGCDTAGCGDWVEPKDDCESQRLFIVDTATATSKVEIEADIDLLFVPSIKIELGKYNSYGATTHSGLTGAEYTVQAMQNGAIIYSKAGIKSGEIIEIMPKTYDNVYLKITETKSPNGYIKINAPINAIMSIAGNKTRWAPAFAPNQETWSKSGFDSSTWGGWTYINDGNTNLPNDYKSNKGDYVNIAEITRNGTLMMRVSAYNEPKINKLELFKIDGTSKAVLAGAKFKATLTNVKEITINGQEIAITSETEINLETDANGKCLIDAIELIDENEPVIITVTEVQAPDSNSKEFYYKKLSDPIVIKVKHTPDGLQVQCSYEGEEEVTAVKNSDDNYSVSVTIPNKVLIAPLLRIELGKYNSYGATTHTGLTGAEYTVQAMQNGEIIYSESGLKSGETIEIRPITFDNVYIKITETKAPNGYIKIEAPINAIMSIAGDKTRWAPSFRPTEEAWRASGFDNTTWGGWTYIDDGNTNLPNDYKSNKGDYVNIAEITRNGTLMMKVSAYNEPKINNLELFKIDGTSKAVLAGAKFKATLTNVKEITINGEEIAVTSETEINLETDANGKCLIDAIELIDENEPVIITVTEIQVPSSNTEDYYYKKLDSPIVITVKHTPNGLQVECSYEGIEEVIATKNSEDNYSVSVTIPNTRVIDVSGKVWLDEQEGIKPALVPDGNIDANEQLLSDIIVKLYEEEKDAPIQETRTDSKGEYKFKNVLIGKAYKVVFEYDGINYESTVLGGDSKADENETERTNFNNKFTTINYKEAVGINGEKTALDYNYSNRKSTLNTTNEDGTIKQEFKMESSTAEVSNGYMTLNKTTTDLNLGLVKRGADIALSTDVFTANVKINGEETEYSYNKEDNSIIIDNTPKTEEVTYNLNLYASDYNYRIKNYFSNEEFIEEDFVNDDVPAGTMTGDDLEVFVTYKLNLQNQSIETTKINEVKYTFDSKYSYAGPIDNTYQISGNVLTINLNGLPLIDGETKTLYIVFKVTEVNNVINTGDFYNSAEITSYSTGNGLIDQDSQPGNFVNDSQNEDDNDTAGGIKIQVIETTERLISGKVFDEENNNVNDVIVQLIELKEVNGKIYEYIWQETVSGTNTGKRVNVGGTELESYTYTKADGYYEFKGFIPGDYIVRFIYGDGTTYDDHLTDHIIKYNGQDYKSMTDSNYNTEWYNNSTYTQGASVARDNEARRLETMAYSVEVNSVKGLLLKLLNNPTAEELNLTEKEILIAIYNSYYESDIVYTKIEDVSDVVINNAVNALLKDVVLPNTWMCAETSKIKVSVATEDFDNVDGQTQVNGTDTTNHISTIPNINLGLELRPVTKIELKKYITGMKLVAANGQELVSAYIDVNEYLRGTTDISSQVKGLKDNLTVLGTKWQYEVPPTEISTKIEGAKLEFEYTLVVENTGANDYLSEALASAYETKTIGQYRDALKANGVNVKTAIKNGSYNIGSYLGANYYVGGEGTAKVKTEVINIRDYVNNDLTFIFDMQGDVAQNTNYSQDNPLVHRILNNEHVMQPTAIKTILETTRSTGKMANTDKEVMYTITLGKDPISVTAQDGLEFENYIAEVMSYTNAAGRRAMTSTPGNAEIIDHEHRIDENGNEFKHEIDEADTAKIQIGAATGEDEVTNYIIIIAAAAGIALVAIGTFVIKKYIIK